MVASGIQPSDDDRKQLMTKHLSATKIRLAPTSQEIGALYNRLAHIAVDAENVYILPAEQQEE